MYYSRVFLQILILKTQFKCVRTFGSLKKHAPGQVTVNSQQGGDLDTMPNDLLFHSFQPWTNARRQEKLVHLSYCAWKTRTELSHVAATLTQT